MFASLQEQHWSALAVSALHENLSVGQVCCYPGLQ
jgi:hypothetical protein